MSRNFAKTNKERLSYYLSSCIVALPPNVSIASKIFLKLSLVFLLFSLCIQDRYVSFILRLSSSTVVKPQPYAKFMRFQSHP